MYSLICTLFEEWDEKCIVQFHLKETNHTHDKFSASKIKDNPPDTNGVTPNDRKSFVTFVIKFLERLQKSFWSFAFVFKGLSFSKTDYRLDYIAGDLWR